MTFVKICGLRTAEHALVAAAAGADLLGMIFAPARRQISPAEAAAISAAVRAQPDASRRPLLVGVFVNEAPERVRELARTCALDLAQLSGNEPIEHARALAGLSLIKAIRFDGSATEQAWIDCNLANVRLLADAHVPGAFGGAGVTADWSAARELARRRPIVLAGGLTPTNVRPAIEQVRPWGVDVSSGVESAGVKDPAKIRAFVAAVQPTLT